MCSKSFSGNSRSSVVHGVFQLFTSVFGIGPSKSKRFIEQGWSSIQEVRDNYQTSDWRVQYGKT